MIRPIPSDIEPRPTKRNRNSKEWKEISAQRLRIARMHQEPCIRCGQAIDYTISGRNESGPTIDHLDPVAITGTEFATLDRLAPAHRVCNTKHGRELQKQMARQKNILQNNFGNSEMEIPNSFFREPTATSGSTLR